jgi:ElaB/YqjD/DUF883 family membrane-anchored ribosome-binding protein
MTKHTNNIDLYDDVEKIKQALREATYDVKGKAAEILSDSVEGVKEQTSEVKDSLEKFTAKKPFKALGISLLVGVAIGYLLRK